MFAVNAVKAWWTNMWAVIEDMLAKEHSLDPLSAEAYHVMSRTSVVMYFAPVPPLARFIQRKLIP